MKQNNLFSRIVFYLNVLFISSIIFNIQNLNAQAVEPLPQGVSIRQLDNGMQVLLIENPALPMVGVNVVVRVGSAYETFATSGMSHMLEHLLFNGTTSRTQKQLYDETDQIGGYNNANTSEYFTNYMMVTPAENIKKGMELQADMLFNSILPEEKFEKEKGIVLEEIAKSLGNPTEQIERNILSVLYPGHALSLPTLGTYTTIKSMNRDDVWQFYKNNYVPNNMFMSVIGNFSTSEMFETIKTIYGKAKPGVIQRTYSDNWSIGFNPLVSQTNDNPHFRFFEGENFQVDLFYEITDIDNSSFFDLIDVALEREQKELQSDLKQKYEAEIKGIKLKTRTSPIADYLQVTITLNNDSKIKNIIPDLNRKLKQLNFVLDPSIVQAEIARARTNFLKNIEKPHMFGIYNAQRFAIQGIESVLASYKGSGLNEAAKLLKDFNFSSNPIIVVQSPVKSNSKEVSKKELQAERLGSKPGSAEVIVVTNPASDLLAIHFMIKHKAQLESKYGNDAAKILHDCIEQRLTAEQNQKVANKYGLTFVFNDNPFIPMDNIYLHPDFSYIRVEGLAEYFDDIVKYLNKQFLDFKPTEEEFKTAHDKSHSGGPMMMMGGNKSKDIFTKYYKSAIYEEKKYPEGQNLNFENLLKFTEEFFVPANMIVSVVSPVEKENVNKAFSEFTAKETSLDEMAYERPLKIQTAPVKIEENMGGEQSYLYWGFIKNIDSADEPALKALSLILADKIIFDIREKQGMAYRMSAGIEVVKDKAVFFINMGTRPQNVDVLLPQLPEFFDLKMVESINETELEKAVNMYLGRMMFRRLSSINRAYYLAHSLYFNNDINFDQNFHSSLRNVKLDDVKRVAQKYLQIENTVSVVIR